MPLPFFAIKLYRRLKRVDKINRIIKKLER